MANFAIELTSECSISDKMDPKVRKVCDWDHKKKNFEEAEGGPVVGFHIPFERRPLSDAVRVADADYRPTSLAKNAPELLGLAIGFSDQGRWSVGLTWRTATQETQPSSRQWALHDVSPLGLTLASSGHL